jgi:nicotinate-nucleotide--dimethylbenzimidazole phosphoribosyltransferase
LRKGLELHRGCFGDVVDTLAALGGFEIATMTGFILECAALRRPVFVDGFITTAAVLAARAVSPSVTDYLFYSHCSAERAHRRVLDLLGARPILDLEMRLGEGTAAALAMGVVQEALSLYRQMATFEQASVGEAQAAQG